MRRVRTILLSLLLISSFPLAARVISYAPYTNRTAIAGYHLRDSRHFPLLELRDEWSDLGQVVLYDSAGVEEPRVIFPAEGMTSIGFVAMWESSSILGEAASLPPMLLAGGGGGCMICSPPSPPASFHFSADGGGSWKQVEGLTGYSYSQSDVDLGGPFVRGLAGQVQLGTAEWPFVVSMSDGVHAVNAKGETVRLTEGSDRLVGRNRAGTRFIIHTASGLKILGLDGSRIPLTPADSRASYSGWITDDGTAYLQMLRPEGRFLFHWKNGVSTFVAGPYNMTPPALNAAPHWTPDTMRFFAVPTADYSGAWMIQRQGGQPTTLSRHSPSKGVETMWSDVSGPEVEALHPGRSGTTVLIQVHRERSVALEAPFLDPALAVWHVGSPAPQQYDELYLNEQWNKGFVHVDPDAIESGEPFVFNSGFDNDPGDIIISPPAGGGDVIQEWGVVRASLKQRLVLPGVARLDGAYDSSWRTDLSIFNPGNESQSVDVTFVPLGATVPEIVAAKKSITLDPWENRAIADVLLSLFGVQNGGGALYFEPAAYGVNVTARTYSRKGAGTFGFGMQGIDVMNAAGPRFPMSFAGAFPGNNFRTNLLLTDTSGRGTEAALSAYGVNGTSSSSQNFWPVPASGIAQYNGVQATLGLFSNQEGGLVVTPTRGTAIATLVAIDNRTNDPTWFPPDLPATPSMMRAIPVIGHVDGANDSHFRSDLYLFNPSSEPATITLEAKSWSTPEQKTIGFSLLPNEARVVPDVLPTLFGMTGLARLRYRSNSVNGIRVTSRTYTVEDSGATYGCLVPPLNNFQMASPGDRLEIHGISGGGAFRTNLALVELSAVNFSSDVTVQVHLVDRNRIVDSFAVTVPAASGMQINDIFAARGLAAPQAGMIMLEVMNGNGLIGAYATLTDNVTNDSTYLGAQLGAQIE